METFELSKNELTCVQGGGEVLGFATEGDKSPYASTIASLAGVIATSPMIQQTTPVNRILRSVLSGVKVALPNMLFPADLVPGVRRSTCPMCSNVTF